MLSAEIFTQHTGVNIRKSTENCILCLLSGSVKVWDPRQKNEPVATMEPGEGEAKRDCWAVTFGRISIFALHNNSTS